MCDFGKPYHTRLSDCLFSIRIGSGSSGNAKCESGILEHMEECSLHPLDLEIVQRYVEALNDSTSAWDGSPWTGEAVERGRVGYAKAKDGDERGAIAVGFGIAQVLAAGQPSFYQSGLSLTSW